MNPSFSAKLVYVGVVVLVAAVIGTIYVAQHDSVNSTGGDYAATGNVGGEHENIAVPSASVLQATPAQTTEGLVYLIEEEKLAHDVYQTLYDIYGARTFNNIQNSETRHQESVLSLLAARGIADPRSKELGVFHSADLQKLYDTLIARGRTSLSEAYAVGVLIEKTDIADIDNTLANLDAAQTDIKTVLDSLRRGSENHLRAFSSKVYYYL